MNRLRGLSILVLTLACSITVWMTPVRLMAQTGDDGYSDIDVAKVHYSNIVALYGQGIFEGTDCGQNRFCPSEPLQRWQMAVWLIRILDAEHTIPTTRIRVCLISLAKNGGLLMLKGWQSYG